MPTQDKQDKNHPGPTSPSKDAESQTQTQTQTQASRKPVFRVLYGVIAALISALVCAVSLVVVALVLLLGTQGGREWLVTSLVPSQLAKAGVDMTVEGFRSPELGYWYFARLQVNQDKAQLLDARQLLLHVDIGALLGKKLDVIELSSEQLAVEIPRGEGEAETSQPESQQGSWQESLLPVRIQKLGVGKLVLSGLGMDIPAFTIDGDAELLWDSALLLSRLNIATLDVPSAELTLNANLDPDYSGAITLSLQEQPGGWIGGLMRLPEQQEVDLEADVDIARIEETIAASVESLRSPWMEYQLRANGLVSWNLSTKRLELDGVRLEVDERVQQITGWWEGEKLSVTASLDRLPVDISQPFQDYVQGGELSGNATAEGAMSNLQLDADLQGQTTYRNTPVKIDAAAKGDMNQLVFERAQLGFGQATLQAEGEVSINRSWMDLSIERLQGPLAIVETFDIALPPELVLDLDVSNGTVTGSFTAPEYAGNLKVAGSYKERPVRLTTGFAGNLDEISLQRFLAVIPPEASVANAAEATLAAEGKVNWKDSQLNLDLDGRNIPLSLAALADIALPEGLSARLNAKGQLSGPLTKPGFVGRAGAEGKYQQTSFDMKTEVSASPDKADIDNFVANLRFANPSAGAERAQVKGAITYVVASRDIDGKLNIVTLPYRAAELGGVEIPEELKGVLNADLALEGSLPVPTVIGTVESAGQYAGEPFTFRFEGSEKDRKLVLDKTQFKWRNTTLLANGEASAERFDLQFSLDNLQLGELQNFGVDVHPGQLDLQFDLEGTPEKPNLKGNVRLVTTEQGRLRDPDATPVEIVVESEFETQINLLLVDNRVTRGGTSAGDLALAVGYQPFLEALVSDPEQLKSSEMPLEASAQGTMTLGWINDFIDRDVQNFGGTLVLDTRVAGTVGDPRLDGTLKLNDGRYENALTQTTLEDATLELALSGQSIRIVDARAEDGRGGDIRLEGEVDLAAGEHGKVALQMVMDEATLIRREDLEGEASGKVSVTGDLQALLVEGRVEVSPFQIMLDKIPDSDIPEIDVTQKQEEVEEQEASAKGPVVRLDVVVNIDQQAFIRGRGLDAELKGRIKVSGTARRPDLNGRFQVIRGGFELFGRDFELEEGDVLFSNDAVSLIVEGRHEGKEYDFIASLSGTLDDLKIGVRTIPPLPEDEAIARLLFGKSVRNITPIQAIQLASAIQTLRGEGGGFDPLGKARDFLNVDTLKVESQETTEGDQGVAVGVGKYVTEGVYVEVERTPEPSQPWKGSVEVELTPNINLETTTGENSGFGGVELQWKYDY